MLNGKYPGELFPGGAHDRFGNGEDLIADHGAHPFGQQVLFGEFRPPRYSSVSIHHHDLPQRAFAGSRAVSAKRRT
jgi:hypothetical protein